VSEADINELRVVCDTNQAATDDSRIVRADDLPIGVIRRILATLRFTDTGWRDIATAPKDGAKIIAYSQDVSGNTGLNPFVSLCAWHPDAGFCTCELREVTHWMPLPPAPTDTGRK